MALSLPGPGKFFRYVYALRAYLLLIVLIFIAFYLLGYAFAILVPGTTDHVISGFQGEVAPMKDLSPLGLMLGIFENNALKTFLVMVLGLAFGIVPAFFTLINGLILGIVSGATAAKYGIIYVAAGTLPHGIVELPMVLISAAMGMRLGVDLLKALLRKNVNMFSEIRECLLIYFCWIFPLLLLAAFLETFVTGPLLYYLSMAHG